MDINAKRCTVCTKVKLFTEFAEHRPGHRRKQCKNCFNNRRLGKTHFKVHEEKLQPVVEHRLKARVRELEEQNRDLAKQLAEGGEYNEIVKEALARPLRQPRIQPRERRSGLREGTPLILASDWHVEERVKPEAVSYRNSYNLDIAKKRMERFFEAIRWVVKQQRDAFKIRDMILWLGGDFITNFLHEDDIENNQLPPLEALLFIQAEMIQGLQFLLEDKEIEQFLIPCNDGNHGRTTKKLRAATRTQHSLEVFLYAQLALYFRNEPRFKFLLPTSQFTYLDDVYGKTIRFLHGDVFRYAGGVGGLTVPLLRAIPRWDSVKRADLSCMGHWHQRICLPTVMTNGSMIGYNAYAMSIGCPYEDPVQSLRMLDSKRFLGSDVPLWVNSVNE